MKSLVNVDGRGRLCVPSVFTRRLGLRAGHMAHIYDEGNTLKISKNYYSTKKCLATYMVDRDDNIRISPRIINNAVQATVSKDYNAITIQPR